jgi:hypothetical protein
MTTATKPPAVFSTRSDRPREIREQMIALLNQVGGHVRPLQSDEVGAWER